MAADAHGGANAETRPVVGRRRGPLRRPDAMTRLVQLMAGAEHGGAEAFFTRLAIALQRAGQEQRVVLRPYPARLAALKAAGIAPVELPFRGGLFDRATSRGLGALIGEYRPRVVLSWMNRATSLCPPGDFVHVARLGGYYDLKYYRGCDHLIANTRGIAAYLTAQGWSADRVHYLPNFPTVAAAGAPPLAGKRPDAQLALALGRLHRNKAFDVLLEALARAHGIHLWLAGEGPERSALETQTRKLGLSDRVRFSCRPVAQRAARQHDRRSLGGGTAGDRDGDRRSEGADRLGRDRIIGTGGGRREPRARPRAHGRGSRLAPPARRRRSCALSDRILRAARRRRLSGLVRESRRLMCGIAGFMTLSGEAPPAGGLAAMETALQHRGPDGYGHYRAGDVGMVQTRLAIIDLATGDQPLYEPSGAALVANGEIYNYIELKQDLPPAVFATASDCEVPLHLYRRFGMDFTRHLRGMYAIALHDPGAGRLILARDPFGIKPLYYVETPLGLAFASEPQALIRGGFAPMRDGAPLLNPAARNELLQLQFTTGRAWYAMVTVSNPRCGCSPTPCGRS